MSDEKSSRKKNPALGSDFLRGRSEPLRAEIELVATATENQALPIPDCHQVERQDRRFADWFGHVSPVQYYRMPIDFFLQKREIGLCKNVGLLSSLSPFQVSLVDFFFSGRGIGM